MLQGKRPVEPFASLCPEVAYVRLAGTKGNLDTIQSPRHTW
jgi:hypothetical protein